MLQEKTKIRWYLTLFLKMTLLAFCSASQAQSLVGNSAIKNFEESTSTDIILQVGNGGCATTITKVQVAKNGLLVTMNKPKSCKFKNLELTMGTDVFPLVGLGEQFELDGDHYKWGANYFKGTLFFAKTENQTIVPLNSLRIREINCTGGSCLTGAMILIAATPANVVVTAPAIANIVAATTSAAEPSKPQAIAVQNQPSSTCADNGDGTFTGKDGTIWQKCVVGQTWQNGSCIGLRKTVNWYEAVTIAKNDRFLGHADWVIPTEQLFRKTFIGESCGNHSSIKKRDSESVLGYWWTSTPGKTNTQAEIMSENTGGGSAYLEYTSRSKNDWNGQPVGVAVSLVRIPVASDVVIILNALSRAENEISKRPQLAK